MIKHHHFIGRFEVIDPPIKGQEIYLKDWLSGIIKRQGMKILSGPHIAHVDVPGNCGLTGVAIIETSHVAVHIWDEVFPALVQLDFYTCGKLNLDDILFSIEDWGVKKSNFMILDREQGLVSIEKK